ncbi:remodeling and spacing factor 1-like [Papaver somniferum]|uniref:remodeling and spacing factor 1-like n=1 Tax=Papaver somniferum TaxID=3469 RepID=UPI000E700431|nr:remodeling and spacing factor 1-like [Papaver somniferum]
MTKKIHPARRKSRVSKMRAISSSNLAGSLSLMANMKYKHDDKGLGLYTNFEELYGDSHHLSKAERFNNKLRKENIEKADQGPKPVDSAMVDIGKAEVDNDESKDASIDDSKGESINASIDEYKGESKDDADASIGITEVDNDEFKDDSKGESIDVSKEEFEGESKVDADASIGITEVDNDESKDASSNESKDASKNDEGARIGITEADTNEVKDTSKGESKDTSKDDSKGVFKDTSKDESNSERTDASKVGADASNGILEVDNSDYDDDGNNDEDDNDNDAAGPSTGCKTRKRCRGFSDIEKEDSLLPFSLDMANWTEQGLCIKCKKGDQVLTCSANGCWVAVHTSCLYVTPNFDDNGYFYCPLCSFKRVLSELDQVKKEKSVVKEKVRIAKRLRSLFIGSSTEEDLTVHEKELNHSRIDAERNCCSSNSGSWQRGSDKAIFVGLENDQQEAVVTTGGAAGNLRIDTCLESENNVVLHTGGGEVTQDTGCPRRNSMEDQHKDIPILSEFDNPSTRRKEAETEMVDKHQNSKEWEQENQVEAYAESSNRNLSCAEAVAIVHFEQITQKDLPILGEFGSPLTQSEEIENEMVENHQHPRESERQMQVETDWEFSERNWPCREVETSKNVALAGTSSTCLQKGMEIEKEMSSTFLHKGKEIEKEMVEEHQRSKESEGEMQVETDMEYIIGDSPCREAETSIQATQNTPLQSNNVDLVGTSSPYQPKGCKTGRRTKSLAKRRARKLPKPKRNPLSWSVEEEDMLKKGVEKVSCEVKKNMPWRSILAFGSSVFHTTRTPEDLKDKWRTMTKGRRHR